MPSGVVWENAPHGCGSVSTSFLSDHVPRPRCSLIPTRPALLSSQRRAMCCFGVRALAVQRTTRSEVVESQDVDESRYRSARWEDCTYKMNTGSMSKSTSVRE